MNNNEPLEWFIMLNTLVQSDGEMIKCAIVGEFFENGKGSMSCHFTSSLISTPQNDLKKNTDQNHDDMYPWEKNQSFWINFEHFDFRVCMKYCLNKHLILILSIVAFFQKLFDFQLLIFFFRGKQRKSSFISTMAIVKIILQE